MPGVAVLDEASARRLCLLQACETGTPEPALWSPEDAAWASRLADETAGPAASDGQWLAERARHAQQRLLPRRPALARVFTGRAKVAHLAAWAALGGLVFGIAADLVGHAQLIDLLAAPVWAVVAWNLIVYAWIAVQALRRLGATPHAGQPGPMRRVAQRWLAGWTAQRGLQGGTPEQRFAARWATVAAPLAADRAAALLHLAAAALAVGLVAGLYARALVLDYRVGWQSTLLDPTQVHAMLSVLLAPASQLTGLAVPDAQAVAALRTAPGVVPAVAGGYGAAAQWIHLLAATLGGAVLVPRLLLALRAASAALWRARRLPVAIDDAATLRRLQSRRRHAGSAASAGVQVLPHGFTPAPAATLGLQRLLAACFGDGVALQIAAPTPYGEEERTPRRAALGRGLAHRVVRAGGNPGVAGAGPLRRSDRASGRRRAGPAHRQRRPGHGGPRPPRAPRRRELVPAAPGRRFPAAGRAPAGVARSRRGNGRRTRLRRPRGRGRGGRRR